MTMLDAIQRKQIEQSVAAIFEQRLAKLEAIVYGPKIECPDDTQRSLMTIRKIVCETYGIAEKSLLANDRRDYLARARFVGCWLARELTTANHHRIAEAFGRTSHKSSFHAQERISEMIESDKSFADRLYKLRDEVKTKLTNPPTAGLKV